jgi:hypothetical protein
LNEPEKKFPLKAFVCENCFLVQVLEFETPDNIFSEYAYFTSYSKSWLQHVESYVNMISEKNNVILTLSQFRELEQNYKLTVNDIVSNDIKNVNHSGCGCEAVGLLDIRMHDVDGIAGQLNATNESINWSGIHWLTSRVRGAYSTRDCRS